MSKVVALVPSEVSEHLSLRDVEYKKQHVEKGDFVEYIITGTSSAVRTAVAQLNQLTVEHKHGIGRFASEDRETA